MKFMKKNNKGFTMVELLAVIVILGILTMVSVTAIQGIIAKAKIRYYQSQEENFVIATKSYLQNNKKEQPKVSGQVKKIYLNKLTSAKYISTIVDYNKEACNIDESYVRVFKYEDEIYYSPYIECPNYKTDLEAYTSNINITTTFTGDDSHLNIAGATIEVKDSEAKDASGNVVDVPHGIVSYQYKIYVEGTLKYTSDVFAANRATEVSKTISLVSHVPGMVKISVTATNMYGISITKSFTKSYRDGTPPACGAIVGASTEWTTGTRKISVACNDGYGSGCKQDVFTHEFTGDVKIGQIEIEDNKGNKKQCNVNVYIDNNAPVLEVKVYKKKADADAKLDNNVVATIKTTNTNQVVNLTVNKNAVGGWLNKATYPNGVFIDVKYNDVSSTSSIEWKWNDKGLVANPSSVLKSVKKVTPASKSGNVTASLVEEGYRQGQIIAVDQFGHKSIININVPMDRTPPTYTKSGDSTTWTKNDRTVTVNCVDPLSSCAEQPGTKTYTSTIKTQKYTLKDKAGNTTSFNANIYVDKVAPSCGTITGASTTWTKNDRTIKVACSDSNSGCSNADFQKAFNATTKVGTVTITDKAGNTKNCNVNAYVDKTAPTCGAITGASTTWTNGNRTIKAKCSDSGSGCSSAEFQATFSATAKTGNITIKDNAGLTTNCPVNVYIDKNKPTCGSISGASTSWTNGNRTITVNCNDSGGSGCGAKSQTFSSTKRTSSITLKDGAGNSVSCGVNVYVDKTAPSCGGVSGASTSWTGGDRNISVNCSDSDSGCSSGSFSRYFNWTVSTDNITIRDKAGNTRNCGVNVYVDKTAPSVWTSQGPSAQRCGGSKGLIATYEVREYESGLSYVGDWWGWDYDFNGANALNRNVGQGSTSFTKTHRWSASCRAVGSPASYCYRIKVLARDRAGNETHFVSPGCAYKG